MGHKTGQIAGNGGPVLADAQAAAFPSDNPYAANRTVSVHERGRAQRLTDIPLLAVDAVGGKDPAVIFKDENVRPFPGKQRFQNIIVYRRRFAVVVEPCGQQVRMAL